jgi:hypothetical protein
MAQKSNPPPLAADPLNSSSHNALYSDTAEELSHSLLAGNNNYHNDLRTLKSSLSTDRTEDVRSGHHFARKFGIGVSLYFKMLKVLSMCFLAMGFVNIALLYSYLQGSANIDEADNVQGGGLSSTTLANVVQSHNSLTWGSLSQRDVFVAISAFDCVSITIFMVTCMFLIIKQDACIEDDDLIQTTPADYTVAVTNIPQDVRDPLEIKRYFETLLMKTMTAEQIEEGFHSVAEVIIHHECTSVLERSEEIAALHEKIYDYEELVANDGNHPSVGRLTDLKAKLANRVVAQEDDLARPKGAVCAFVTFENDEGKDTTVALFKKLKKLRRAQESCCASDAANIASDLLELSADAKFRGSVDFAVRRAHEPVDILFENLERTPTFIFAGRVFSFLLTIIVLILALSFIFAIKVESKRLKPDTSDCNPDVEYTKEMAELSKDNKECYCGAEGFEDLSFCSDMIWGTLYSYSASILTAIVNYGLAHMINKTAKWQCWQSRSSEMTAILVSTFVAQFLNTAVILVIVNLNYKAMFGIDLGKKGIDGFGFDWYNVVATPILLNVCMNSVVPHVVTSVRKLYNRFCIWRKQGKMKTQKELNRLYAKSVMKFNLAERFAMVLTTVFICNSLSAGLPLMPFVASFTFFLLYRIDKSNIIMYHLARKKDKYDGQMAEVVADILPMSGVLHCFFSIVLWSDKWLSPHSIDMPENSGFLHRALLHNTLPLTILLCLFFFICTAINSTRFYNMVAPDFLRLSDKEADLGMAEDDPSWSEFLASGASNDHVISYDVCESPHYKHLLCCENVAGNDASLNVSMVGGAKATELRKQVARTLVRKLSDGPFREDSYASEDIEGGFSPQRESPRSSDERPPIPGFADSFQGRSSSLNSRHSRHSVPHIDEDGDEFFHGRSEHTLTPAIETPFTHSSESTEELLNPQHVLLAEGDRLLEAMGADDEDDGQHMLTPHGSYSSHPDLMADNAAELAAKAAEFARVQEEAHAQVAGAQADNAMSTSMQSATSVASGTTTGTAGTPNNRHSQMCDDHHAIADIFFGDVGIIEQQHETRKETKRRKRKNKKAAAKGENYGVSHVEGSQEEGEEEEMEATSQDEEK